MTTLNHYRAYLRTLSYAQLQAEIAEHVQVATFAVRCELARRQAELIVACWGEALVTPVTGGSDVQVH